MSCSRFIPNYEHIDSKLRDGQAAAYEDSGKSVNRDQLPGYAGCQPSHVARGCGKVDMVNENDWRWYGKVDGRNDRVKNRVLGRDNGTNRQEFRSRQYDAKDSPVGSRRDGE